MKIPQNMVLNCFGEQWRIETMMGCKYGKALYGGKDCYICSEYKTCKGGTRNVKERSARDRAKSFSGSSSKTYVLQKERGF